MVPQNNTGIKAKLSPAGVVKHLFQILHPRAMERSKFLAQAKPEAAPVNVTLTEKEEAAEIAVQAAHADLYRFQVCKLTGRITTNGRVFSSHEYPVVFREAYQTIISYARPA